MDRQCVIALACGAVMASSAGACFIPPPPIVVDPPPRVFWEVHAPGDFWVWVELRDVFDTDMDHDCSCALGLERPLPFSMAIADQVEVGVFNTESREIVERFSGFDNLGPSAPSTMGWGEGPDVPDALTGSPQVDNWYGYGGVIPAVTSRMLEENEIFVVCFQFDVPRTFAVTETISAQIGGGLGNPDFSPLFDVRPDPDSHFPAYSNVFQFPIPTPGVAGLLVMGGVFGAARRRR